MLKYITLSDIQNDEILTNYIYNNNSENYYVTDDWSMEMYDALAFAGFISITIKNNTSEDFLLPEMQFSYAGLSWKNLHISKRLKKFIVKNILDNDNYSISINKNFEAVLNGIKIYHNDINWVTENYINTLKSCRNSKCNTNVISVELWDNEKLIAGEIGYIIGSTYTSLTGFFDKQNYSNFGKIQLLALSLLLKKSNIMFWNMGHPYMNYKFKMGAIEYQRQDFLEIWKTHREENLESNILNAYFNCTELFKEIL